MGGGKQRSESSVPKDFAKIAKKFYEETTPLRQELQSQLLEALSTGGVTAQIPIIARSEEATRQATARTLRELNTELARTGLAGTPFAARTTAEALQRGAYEYSRVGPNYAAQLISQIPGYALGSAQAVTSAIPGLRETTARGKSFSI